MCSIGFKYGLQVGLILRLNTLSDLNQYQIQAILIFSSIQIQIRNSSKTIFFRYKYNIRILLNRGN